MGTGVGKKDNGGTKVWVTSLQSFDFEGSLPHCGEQTRGLDSFDRSLMPGVDTGSVAETASEGGLSYTRG